MDNNTRNRAMNDAITAGDWDSVIEHASHLPPNWNSWETIPSAAMNAHPEGIPNEYIHKMLDIMSHKFGRHSQNLPNFLFELSHNLGPNVSKDVLQRGAEIAKDGDYLAQKNFMEHPNFELSDEQKNRKVGADFWSNYEKKVDPSHFATIKSMYTGKPEKITDHRNQTGESQSEIIPHLHDHAKYMQDRIMKDEWIKKRYFNGKPYVKLYRGVGSEYGKKLHEAAEYNPKTNEAKAKNLNIPTAHLTSWTTDPQVAKRFAHGRGNIDAIPSKHGVVMSKYIPVDQILHSGQHASHPGHVNPHPDENEIVIGHPTGSIKVNTKDMEFQHPESQYGTTVKPNIKKSEEYLGEEICIQNVPDVLELNKSMKHNIASAAVALSMLGAPAVANEKDMNSYVHHNETANKPHPGLAPIKYIESSGGKNLNHPLVSTGLNAGTKAIGSYAMMPYQVQDILKNDKHLSSKYPELKSLHPLHDQDKMRSLITKNPKMETDLVNSHWSRLNKIFEGNVDKMVHAWNRGIGRTLKTDENTIKNYPYVQKYHKYNKMLMVHTPDLKKTEPHELHNVQEFQPIENQVYEKEHVIEINEAIKNKQIRDLENVGHFTHDSFIAGSDDKHSWLIKVEPSNKSGVKSVQNSGLQVIRESAFYHIGSSVFNMGNFMPDAILGVLLRDQEQEACVAIKMFNNNFYDGNWWKKNDKQALSHVLEPYRKNGELHKLGAMLYVLGESDCHLGNIMTDGHELKIIDHGASFADSSFNPGIEHKVFIPSFLRFGRVKSSMSKNEKLKAMPIIDDMDAKKNANHWILSVNVNDLETKLTKYELDPKPVLERLRVIQKMIVNGSNLDEVVNILWVFGLELNNRGAVNEINS